MKFLLPFHPDIRPRICLIAAMVAVLPIAGTQIAVAQVQAQAVSVVGSIQFAGRMNVGEETLRAALKLKVDQPFTPAAMEADRTALLGLGYFRSVTASQTTTGGKTDITYRLVEWPTVKHIRIQGNTVVDQRTIRDATTTRLGEVLSSRRLLDDIRAIEKLYEDRGYVAHVGQRILDEATMSGILRFDILEVQIAEVSVEGGTPRMRERSRKLLVEVPPELYRPSAVALDQQRLLRVKDVKNAVARVEPITPSKVRIRWVLNPQP